MSSRQQGAQIVNPHRRINLRAFLIASAVAVVAFLGLGAVAFTHASHKTAITNVPYTQKVTFGYEGSAPSSPVYPSGAVHTGDPIFLQFVHQLHVQVAYSLAASATHQVSGTEQVLLRLTGPTGWTRTLQLTALRHFAGSHATSSATLDLDSLQALIKQIQKLTGVSTASGYTIAVVPQVHVAGTLARQPLATSFNPVLSLQLAPPQLRPSATLSPAQHGTVQIVASVANRVSVAGASVTVKTLRGVAVCGFLLALLSAVLVVVLIKRSTPFGEAGRIQAQYGHLIVPIAGTAEDLAWAPFDVPNVEALVRLAEACDRLILHYREDTLDTYLVNDEGTVYRYQSRHSGVVWGEWSTAPVAKLDSVPPPGVAQEAPARA
jgi:hypothetical protein